MQLFGKLANDQELKFDVSLLVFDTHTCLDVRFESD